MIPLENILKTWKNTKEKFPTHLLAFKIGDFYEFFKDDAIICNKIIGVTLTTRTNANGEKIPLAGFPYHSFDSYMKRLIKEGVQVAVMENVNT